MTFCYELVHRQLMYACYFSFFFPRPISKRSLRRSRRPARLPRFLLKPARLTICSPVSVSVYLSLSFLLHSLNCNKNKEKKECQKSELMSTVAVPDRSMSRDVQCMLKPPPASSVPFLATTFSRLRTATDHLFFLPTYLQSPCCLLQMRLSFCYSSTASRAMTTTLSSTSPPAS